MSKVRRLVWFEGILTTAGEKKRVEDDRRNGDVDASPREAIPCAAVDEGHGYQARCLLQNAHPAEHEFGRHRKLPL